MAIELKGNDTSTYSSNLSAAAGTFTGNIEVGETPANPGTPAITIGDGTIEIPFRNQAFAPFVDVGTVQTGFKYCRLNAGSSANAVIDVETPDNASFFRGTKNGTRIIIENDGTTKIGGTLPDTPNIALRSDGTSTFDGQMSIASNKVGSVSDCTLSLAGTGGDFYALQFDASDIAITSVGSSSPRLSFRNSGDAILLDIFETGVIRGPGIFTQSVTGKDVFVDSNGTLGFETSLRASKGNINPLSDVSWLYNLNPITFNYRKKTESGAYSESELESELSYGLIAEEVAEVAPEVCYYSRDGELEGVGYKQLIIPLLAALKEQATRIEALEAEIQNLKGEINNG